jgi:hypothetical protein
MDKPLDSALSSSLPFDQIPAASPHPTSSQPKRPFTPAAQVAADKLSESRAPSAFSLSTKTVSLQDRVTKKAAQVTIDTFKSKFILFLKDKCPNLILDDKQLTNKFHELASMGCSFEDYMEQLKGNPEINTLLQSINTNMPHDETQATFLKNLVTDLLLCTYLIPSKEKVKNKSSLYRHALQIFTPKSLTTLLQTLSETLAIPTPVDLSKIPQLAHLESQGISIDTYAAEPLAKKMLLLSLSHITHGARDELLKDPLFKKIQESPYLIDWMLASTGSLEQNYLNTCLAASLGQEIVSKIPTIVGLLLVGKYLSNGIEASVKNPKFESQPAFPVWWKKDPTTTKYVGQRLAQVQQEFELIRKKADAILKEESTPTKGIQKRREKLTETWNQNFQRLAAIADTEDVIVLTKKPIKEHWTLSAVLMFFVSILSFTVPGLATFRSRLKDINVVSVVDKLKDIGVNLNKEPFDVVDAKDFFSKELDPQVAREKFWEHVFSQGGLLFSSSTNHMTYVKAVNRGGEKIFLLGDPKQSNYQIISLEKMRNLIKKRYSL